MTSKRKLGSHSDDLNSSRACPLDHKILQLIEGKTTALCPLGNLRINHENDSRAVTSLPMLGDLSRPERKTDPLMGRT